MKPQKKAVVAKKATKMPTVAKKRRAITEKTMSDVRKDKKSKKTDKLEDPKKKVDNDKKKLEKVEEKKKIDDKKKERSDKPDEKKKQVNKDCEKVEEKKAEKGDEKTSVEDVSQELVDKKKAQKCEEKAKLEKQSVDNKKKVEKTEEKKKNVKLDDNTSVEDTVKTLNTMEDKDALEEKIDALSPSVNKKKGKDEKKRDVKLIKSDVKSISKNSTVKDKKSDRKKIPEKDAASNKVSSAKTKKDSKAKQGQNKGITRKTVLTKKPHLSVVKRLVDKKIKLVKPEKDEEMSEDEDTAKRAKKKSSSVAKSKATQEKKPKLAKHMKAKLPTKHSKISAVLKREDKLKTITEKIMAKKKIELKETEEVPAELKKVVNKDEACQEPEVSSIKSEIDEERDSDKTKEDGPHAKLQDNKKAAKSGSKVSGKMTKKTGKTVKVQNESNNQTTPALSEDVIPEESNKQPKVSEDSAKPVVSSKQEQAGTESTVELDLKVETMNGESASGVTSQSDSEDDSDEEYKRSKQKDARNKERANSPSDERARRMRLFGFWNAPKRHRVASLNALAKVHCLYENETGGVYLGGFCKPKPEKEKEKPKKLKEEKEEQQPPRKEKEKKAESKTEENVLKRKLRNVPGLRGKHWDMLESSSSSSSSDEDCEKEKNAEPSKKKMIKRRRRNEEVMDLKDMVVCKRMASLNATAILAASYSDEKNRCGSSSSSSSSDSSSESEVEIIRKRRPNDSDVDKKKSRQGSDPEEVIKPSKKVVIVNQDTDVTITGVYVNQTRSTHHEGFCSIAGMQYRISSTSHTQTAATAVATELHDQQKTEQPCKSYTPLGALSSMQPPGSHQGNHPNMSPRRHSAFSAPHQHGYYQPAGPLIQHPPPPTLPPVKGPPPEPTPTPPQNSEGSDDLVASTTSGGTSSTGGGFYRTYCPQYYSAPQYPDLCYQPTYSHPHAHPPHYYKYSPYRRQYYGYQETGGGGPPPGSGAAGGGPGVVDYQPPPPPPGEYPLPPYYAGYPPHPPPPPPPNPAYLHSQGRPFVDPFQGCPCPMQSCPKNVDTGALIGNGKGAPVVSGPGLSLPPSALVGPPSPARGLAGLAPPHGANAWDTDRVQINTHRNLNQNQQPSSVPPSHNLVGGHSRLQNQDCRSKDEQNCTEDTLRKCGCQNACTSTCEVKMETLSPTEKLSVAASCPSGKYRNFKLENNNVKCESCTMDIADGLPCAANCNVVKCESDYKCDIMKCEQCMKEGQIAIMEMDKDSGIVLDDKLDSDPDVKEELDVVVIDSDENWKKPDYEPTVQETVDDKEEDEGTEEAGKEQEEVTQEKPVAAELEPEAEAGEQPKCQKVTKRKLSLDSLSDSRKKRKLSKRALSVGSSRDASSEQPAAVIAPIEPLSSKTDSVRIETSVLKKKQTKKDAGHRGQKRKAETPSANESAMKKAKSGKQQASNSIGNLLKRTASDISIMETIDDVIQQSLQMTQRKDRKEKKKKKKEESSPITKKAVKKADQAKEHVANEKMVKAVAKNSQFKSKVDAKLKPKTPQDGKAKGKSKSGKVTEIKAHDTKCRVQEPSKIRDSSKKRDTTASKTKASDVSEDPKKSAVIKKKRKSAKKTTQVKKSSCKVENSSVGNESLTLTRKTFLKPKWNNGWSWEGEPFEAKVYLTNEETAIRRCYASMSHESGDVLRPRDCVLLKSGTRKGDLPYVAKIAALWENPDDGEMMFSLLWYYRPEHTEQGRTPHDSEDEVFASRHRDANSVACIEDKCYILTFNEYCRYRKNLRRIEEGLENPGLIVPPGDQVYPRENRQPPIPVPSDMVLFCRRVYDYRGKKLVKNPG